MRNKYKIALLVTVLIVLLSAVIVFIYKDGTKPQSITTVQISHGSFVTDKVVVSKGDAITIVNADEIDHVINSNVFGISSMRLDAKSQFTYVLNDPGTWIFMLEDNPFREQMDVEVNPWYSRVSKLSF